MSARKGDDKMNRVDELIEEINIKTLRLVKQVAEMYKITTGKDYECTLACRLCGERYPWAEIVDGGGDCKFCRLQGSEI